MDELDTYDRRMEERDGVKVRHLRRIAEALELIAGALATSTTYVPDDGDDGDFIRVGLGAR